MFRVLDFRRRRPVPRRAPKPLPPIDETKAGMARKIAERLGSIGLRVDPMVGFRRRLRIARRNQTVMRHCELDAGHGCFRRKVIRRGSWEWGDQDRTRLNRCPYPRHKTMKSRATRLPRRAATLREIRRQVRNWKRTHSARRRGGRGRRHDGDRGPSAYPPPTSPIGCSALRDQQQRPSAPLRPAASRQE